ncbi:MAG: NHLP family bacteriocin export ABC transporter peptidase/permease/ATPase subunit [Pseudomonadota bacterium]
MASDAVTIGGVKLPLGGWNRVARARTDSVLQFEAAECGAASLAMILSHFGRRAPLEELRIACGVSRDGSKASSILKAARAYGLEAKGLKAEPEHLRGLRMPLIAFVNFNHFLVVEGLTDSTVFLNDPATGPRKVSIEEFDAMFTGVVLTFAKGEAFKAADTRPSVAQILRNRLRGFQGALLFILLASLALVIPGIVIPAFGRVFVDFILVEEFDHWLAPLLIAMAATAVLRAGLVELQAQHLLRMEARLATEGSQALLWRLLRLPVQFFSQRFAGEIGGRLDLNDALARLLTGELARALLSLVTAFVLFAVMLTYSIRLALIAGLLTLINAVLLAVVSRVLADGWRNVVLENAKLRSTAIAGLRDIETYKAAGAEDTFFARWVGHLSNVVNSQQRLGLPLLLMRNVPALLQTLTMGAVLVVGGLEVMAGAMSLGMLVAFQTLTASFTAPVTALTEIGPDIQRLQAFTARLGDIEQQPIDPRFAHDAAKRTPDRLPVGAIALNNVTFGYSPVDPPLIDKFDLAVQPGERIALVGPSGSGKSTIGRIVAGLCEPQSGQVEIDGTPLGDWPSEAISARLAYVDQDITLFEGTIRDNLSLWDPTLPEQDIVAAAQDAQIHDFIVSRPGGYDGLVEEDGRNMSGGQRQRLDLARALARNPSMIVLDEATSALDPVTELTVLQAIRRRGATCIIIAHRLSAIRDCDQIIVLDHGQPIEQGRHDVLVRSGGAYAGLIET